MQLVRMIWDWVCTMVMCCAAIPSYTFGQTAGTMWAAAISATKYERGPMSSREISPWKGVAPSMGRSWLMSTQIYSTWGSYSSGVDGLYMQRLDHLGIGLSQPSLLL